jgi:hypothetical protein
MMELLDLLVSMSTMAFSLLPLANTEAAVTAAMPASLIATDHAIQVSTPGVATVP